MSYPVILYPKLIQDFRLRYPIPPSSEVFVETDAKNSFTPRPSLEPQLTDNWLAYPLIVAAYAILLLWVGPLPSATKFQLGLVVAVGVLVVVAIGALLWNDCFRLTDSIRVTTSDEDKWQSALIPPLKPAQSALQVTSRGKLLQKRLSFLASTLHNQVKFPVGVSNAPIGASEAAFGQVLESFFPGRVVSQLEFPIPGSEHSYSTDFAILFDEINLSIDCEIDEPYELKSNKPTHCTDQRHDRYRNQFFLEGNWIVVRFSEEQVVCHPKSCCKELAALVAAVTGIERYLLKFEGVCDLPLKPQWTKSQAKQMAKRRYRSRYLQRRE